MSSASRKYVRPFDDSEFLPFHAAGGKASALLEMSRANFGLRIPPGFVITTEAYLQFLKHAGIDQRVADLMRDITPGDLISLQFKAREIRRMFEATELPADLQGEIIDAYDLLNGNGTAEPSFVAVRSSATAEDLPEASFAGMHDTFLHVRGPQQLCDACRRCFASLYTDRAIRYRAEAGVKESGVAMAILVQQMVPSVYSGVTFTVDAESGFESGIVVNAVFGLGEGLVRGHIDPDEYLLFKPALDSGDLPILGRRIGKKETEFVWSEHDNCVMSQAISQHRRDSFVLPDQTLTTLGQQCLTIERYFSMKAGRLTPMDIEWAVDPTGRIWILQARPLTSYHKKEPKVRTYTLTGEGKILVTGLPIGRKISQGRVAVLTSSDQMEQFERRAVLVTDMTDPSWLPIMRRASAIVTNRGGRTSHAAIVCREMGIPCIVGTGKATEILKAGQPVTVSCVDAAEGRVYDGMVPFEVRETVIDDAQSRTKIMFITGLPDAALAASALPNDGVAMGREEFIIYSYIGIHPLALINYDTLKSELESLTTKAAQYHLTGLDQLRDVVETVERLTRGYAHKTEFLVDRLAEGMAKIAAAVYPKEVHMKLCDFKTNEFKGLIGGYLYEPYDGNPMIGWRSASRYYAPQYRPILEAECRAFRRVREEMGFKNMHLMVPFCRSAAEGRKVVDVLRECGIVQHKDGLLITGETEVPASVIDAEEFAKVFDRFTIGSNDLAQTVLATDRDSEMLAHLFDERDPAVLKFIKEAIDKIHALPPKIVNGKELKIQIGLCGVAVSTYPDFARFLVASGIDFIGLEPEANIFLDMRQRILEIEQELEVGSRSANVAFP